MSGTSLDGVDAALVDFGDGSPEGWAGRLPDGLPDQLPNGLPNVSGKPRTVTTHYASFAPGLRSELAALQAPSDNELHRAALAANELARAYAAAVYALLDSAPARAAGIGVGQVAAIGAHGQTVRHRPELGFTIQLNNPALLAELTGIAVVADFRSRDIAAGGQGAPLVPAFHRAVFADAARHRVIVNIGGIANLTSLPPQGSLSGFDTGPGNGLMDGWAAQHLNQAYDAGGAWAATGTVLPALLARLLDVPFFNLPPPKSTGRDLFNAAWLQQRLSGSEAPPDVQATLCALTAHSVAHAVTGLRPTPLGANTPDPNPIDAFVCGGGAHNLQLMAALRAAAPAVKWDVTDALGVPADWVEAVAFAWLARQTVTGAAGNIAAATGARGARVLGALYAA